MEIIETVEKLVKFSQATMLIAEYKLLIFIISFIVFDILTVYIISEKLYCNRRSTFTNIIIIIAKTYIVLSIITFGVLKFKPTLIDKIGIMVNYPVQEQVTDKNKYNLSLTKNKDYLKFDNKGNNNIKLMYNNKEVNEKIFKLIEENDKEYLIELEVVDYGIFSDTVRTEKVSIHK